MTNNSKNNDIENPKPTTRDEVSGSEEEDTWSMVMLTQSRPNP
jgi:hypothetical protein